MNHPGTVGTAGTRAWYAIAVPGIGTVVRWYGTPLKGGRTVPGSPYQYGEASNKHGITVPGWEGSPP